MALIRSLIAANASSFANGYHFLGHSQGGLMLRSVIQSMDDHNVNTFVSMAGVQLGMYVSCLCTSFIITFIEGIVLPCEQFVSFGPQ